VELLLLLSSSSSSSSYHPQHVFMAWCLVKHRDNFTIIIIIIIIIISIFNYVLVNSSEDLKIVIMELVCLILNKEARVAQ
jgi:hypothetical protein